MIYISGKITGTTDYIERFAAAEEALRAQGYVPVNPAKVNAQMPPETKYPEYMKLALAMLELCDKIYMLSGWQFSRGAWLEHDYAIATGKEILYQEVENGSDQNNVR